MTRLSEEAKKSIVEKALAKDGKSLTEIALLHNIGYSTLQKWIFNYKHEIGISKNSYKAQLNIQLTRSEQFQHLLATSTLDETALGAYCREHGLYSFQMQQWKKEFMSKNDGQKKQDQQSELKALRAENKALKQDLLRKDRALAETTALLVLKKKADLIWGEPEGD
jgi:transposase-like protein